MAEQRAAVDRLALAQRWIEVAPAGDWVTGLRDEAQIERMRVFLEEHATPDIDIAGKTSDELVLVPPSAGSAGLLSFWQDWLEPWESFYIDMENVREGSEGVLIEAVQRGRLRGSAAEVETPSAAVLFVREGLMSRIEFHLDRDMARRAAGL
jgi:hypothetical protein